VKRKALRALAAAGIFALACCACSSPARPPTFDAMLSDSNNLTAVLGPVTGTGSRMLTVPASRSMSLTVGCIGKGVVEVRGLLSGAELCKDASIGRGAFGGWYWAHLPVRPGEHIKLRVVADARTTWDIRVDGLPRHCKGDTCTG
jgi:hypothetical protein